MSDERTVWVVQSEMAGKWHPVDPLVGTANKREAEIRAKEWSAKLGHEYRAWPYVPKESA